jgi:hypothetical protein
MEGFLMALRFGLGLVAAMVVAITAHAAPKPKAEPECQIEGGPFDLDKVEKALQDAPTCSKSLQLFSHCQMGAGSDVHTAGIITEKCEAEFLPRLTKARRQAYKREQNRCYRKYRNEQGSMYRSAEAYCAAEVAERHARRFGKSKTRPAKN